MICSKRLIASLVVVFPALAQAQTTLYSEDFSGDGLSTAVGTLDDTAGVAWQGASFFLNNGQIDSPGAGNARGPLLLPFNPEANKIYTATGTMTVGTGNTLNFGFSQFIDNIRFHNQAGLTGWAYMFTGPTGQDAYEGPRALGDGNVLVGTNEVLGTDPVTLKIILDTTGTQWTASFYVNDLVFTENMEVTGLADASVGSINYVGFSAGNSLSDLDSLDSFSLTVTDVTVPADLDADGDVDDADFGIAFAAFTGPGGVSESPADLDNDGDVDDADFGIAFAAFTGPGGSASVPEPATLTVAALAGLMFVRRRRHA